MVDKTPSTGAQKKPSSPGRSAVDEYVGNKLARDAYERAERQDKRRAMLVVGGCLALSLTLNAAQAFRPVATRYIPTDATGRIIELRPLSQPVGTPSDIATWTARAVSQALTFDFANYRAELSDAQANFTPGGWTAYENGLQGANILQYIIDNQSNAVAHPTGAPQLLTSGLIQGRFAWQFSIPMLISYRSAKNSSSVAYQVEVTVVRQPETDQALGLGIETIRLTLG